MLVSLSGWNVPVTPFAIVCRSAGVFTVVGATRTRTVRPVGGIAAIGMLRQKRPLEPDSNMRNPTLKPGGRYAAWRPRLPSSLVAGSLHVTVPVGVE